jgi:glucose uptake protein GlcU
MGVGLAFASVAVVCFGSNFVVTKKYKSGDGIFFQWVMAAGILTAGLILWLLQCNIPSFLEEGAEGCPRFEPIAMLGGALWACGNVWVVPIVKTIGLSMGLLIWGSSNMFMGWATGRFGWFGLTAQSVSKPVLNDIAVGLAGCALLTFVFVKPTLQKLGAKASAPSAGADSYYDDGLHAYGGRGGDAEFGGFAADKPLIGSSLNSETRAGAAREAAGDDEETSWTDSLSPAQKTAFGITMSLVSGLLYGSNFDPPQYVVDHASEYPGASADNRAYVFPHFVGIFITATLFVMIYAAAKRNAPVVYPEIMLPGYISGIIWSAAQISWFYANNYLDFVVSFPIISVGPGLVGALWGVFVFGEIRGVRNYIALTVAFAFTIASAVLITLSK